MKAEIKRHWRRVAAMGCIVTGAPEPTIHHVHGGSMKIYVHRGMRQKTSDWLVIPLCAELHTGNLGIDNGCMTVAEWEQRWGTQVEMLDRVSRELGIDVWKRAGVNKR